MKFNSLSIAVLTGAVVQSSAIFGPKAHISSDAILDDAVKDQMEAALKVSVG